MELTTSRVACRVANRLELQARIGLRQGDSPPRCRQPGIRQEGLDYRGMARALAVAALAAERAGERELAADLFLRAGRSAAAQSDADTARQWLELALSLTSDDAAEQPAEAALDGLR